MGKSLVSSSSSLMVMVCRGVKQTKGKTDRSDVLHFFDLWRYGSRTFGWDVQNSLSTVLSLRYLLYVIYAIYQFTMEAYSCNCFYIVPETFVSPPTAYRRIHVCILDKRLLPLDNSTVNRSQINPGI